MERLHYGLLNNLSFSMSIISRSLNIEGLKSSSKVVESFDLVKIWMRFVKGLLESREPNVKESVWSNFTGWTCKPSSMLENYL